MPDMTAEEKAALYDEVAQDKGLFRQLQRALAAKHPDVRVPEVELSQDIEAVQAKAQKDIDDLKAQLQAEKDARVAAEALAQAKAEHGLDDESLKAATEFMQKNGITDLDTGLKFQRLAAAEDARKAAIQDRNTMALPAGFMDALKDRRGARRRNLYAGLNALREQTRHANVLATL